MQLMSVTLIWRKHIFLTMKNQFRPFAWIRYGSILSRGYQLCRSAELIGLFWLCLQLVTWRKKKKKRKNYLDISFFYTMCLTTLCSWIFNKLTMKLGSLTKQKRSSCLLWFITTLPTKYYFGYNIVGMANSTYFH